VRIVLNGESTEVADGIRLADLIAIHTGKNGDEQRREGEQKAKVPGIAVALNSEVVPRSKWAQTLLRPEDRVEILGASQGG
jgi:sulfur carrier protein